MSAFYGCTFCRWSSSDASLGHCLMGPWYLQYTFWLGYMLSSSNNFLLYVQVPTKENPQLAYNKSFLLLLFCFWDKLSLCSPGYPGSSLSIEQAGLKLRSACLCHSTARIKGACHHHHLANITCILIVFKWSYDFYQTVMQFSFLSYHIFKGIKLYLGGEEITQSVECSLYKHEDVDSVSRKKPE